MGLLKKKDKSLELTIPKTYELYGVTVKKLPVGKYVEYLKKSEDLPYILLTGADLTDVQRAAEYWYLIKCSFGANKWSFATDAQNLNAADRLNLYCDRLRGVIIENRDFEHLIKTYDRPGACFYCDPPYVDSERYYRNNLNNFKTADHERLKAVLKTMKGRFILSYNDCDFVRGAYKAYNIRSISRRNLLPATADSKKEFKEVIITNF